MKAPTLPTLGFHHQVGRVGAFTQLTLGFLQKRLKDVEVKYNQNIREEDNLLFLEEVREDAESETFATVTAGFTFSF